MAFYLPWFRRGARSTQSPSEPPMRLCAGIQIQTAGRKLSPARRGWEGGDRLAGRFPIRTLRWGRSVVRPGS